MFLFLLKKLQEFCGFSKVPDAPPFLYLKKDFQSGYNLYGYYICTKDNSLDMKYVGNCHENSRFDRYKRVFPMVHMERPMLHCQESSNYLYLCKHGFSYISRHSSRLWIIVSLYKIRTIVERAITLRSTFVSPEAKSDAMLPKGWSISSRYRQPT